jgi:hypothetical protein
MKRLARVEVSFMKAEVMIEIKIIETVRTLEVAGNVLAGNPHLHHYQSHDIQTLAAAHRTDLLILRDVVLPSLCLIHPPAGDITTILRCRMKCIAK